jgi:hypothetical protein
MIIKQINLKGDPINWLITMIETAGFAQSPIPYYLYVMSWLYILWLIDK